MNLPKLFLRSAPVAVALCVGFCLIPAGRAQPAPQSTDNRFLFIFDTSADMKKRLPAVQAEVNNLMAHSLGGQFHAGDSLGVWTFDQNLRTGQFPLQHWTPESAVKIASDINNFVGKQHYAKRTSFNALQPQLNQVILGSERLTVLIFCDGEDEIKWTPYDTGINQVFQQRLAELKKARQPFVLVLRTQLGQYIGCTVNFPPGMVSLPEFPPLPPPPAPAKKPPATLPAAPVIKPLNPTPLIIIGTKVETNWPPGLTNSAPAAPTNPMAPLPTNVVPAAPTNPVTSQNPVALPPTTNPVPMVQTNAVPAPSANPIAPTNFPPLMPTKPVRIPGSNPMVSAKPVAPLPENSSPDHKGALAIGVALLVAAGALFALVVFRSRRSDRNSLITRSMRKD